MQNKQTPFSAGLRDALLQSAEEAHVNEAELKQMFYSELFPTFADTLLSGAELLTNFKRASSVHSARLTASSCMV